MPALAPVPPVPSIPLPLPPSSTDIPNFDARGDAFNLHLQQHTEPEFNALALNAFNNAVVAAAAASAATDKANIATDQAVLANTAKVSAQTSAADAATQAAAVQVLSKLQLGAKSAPPTTDNEGGALQVGAQYYDTTLLKVRTWTGALWVEALAASTAVEEALAKKMDSYGIAKIGSINDIINPGFYLLDIGLLDVPPGYVYNQMMVTSWPYATVTQMIFSGPSQLSIIYRSKVVNGSWGSWIGLATNGANTYIEKRATAAVAGGGLTLDLSNAITSAALNANITSFGFANILASATTCQSHTLELIGDGTQRTVVWPGGDGGATLKFNWPGGIAPTLTKTAGKVDTFFFKSRSQWLWDAYIVGQNQ